MNKERIVASIKGRNIVAFRCNFSFDSPDVFMHQGGLNVYQIACYYGVPEIMKYLEDNGFGFLANELDDEISFI